MSYSVNWSISIVWLPLLSEILSNMHIVTVCFPGSEIMNFEFNYIFLNKPFSYMIKDSKQKLKYLENENNF